LAKQKHTSFVIKENGVAYI